MKIECLQENLARGMNSVIKIVGSKIAVASTQNVLIKAEEENIKITTTNLETIITTTVNAKCEELGTFSLSAKLFYDIVNAMHSEKVNIFTIDNACVGIKAGKTNVKLQTIDVNTFPVISHCDNTSFGIETSKFRELTETAIYAASRNKNEILSGILFRIFENRFTVVSTDGYRLCENKIEIENQPGEIKFVLPVNSVENVLSAIGNNNELIKIGFKNNMVTFSNSSTIISSLRSNAIYPNYEPVIPKQSTNKIIVEVGSILHAVKIANLFSPENKSISVMNNGSVLLIKSSSSVFGEGMDEINCQPEGNNIEFIVNGDFLLETLNKIKDVQIEITSNTSSSPIAIRPVNNKENNVHVLMPMYK